jgi:hypothetical protein
MPSRLLGTCRGWRVVPAQDLVRNAYALAAYVYACSSYQLDA